MKKPMVCLLIAMTAFSAAAESPAAGFLLAKRDRQEDRGQERGRESRDEGRRERRRIEPDEAAARAMRKHGGRVVGVQRQTRDDGEDYYSIKLLDGGRLRIVDVPAER